MSSVNCHSPVNCTGECQILTQLLNSTLQLSYNLEQQKQVPSSVFRTLDSKPSRMSIKTWLLSATLVWLIEGISGHRLLPSYAQGGIAQKLFQKSPLQGEEAWIDMPVDHFDQANTKTFRNKYYVETSFWNAGVRQSLRKVALSGSPFCRAILIIGGEGAVSGIPLQGFEAELAKDLGALLVSIEHRYYGESLPFGNPFGLQTPQLNFLNTSQALADAAALIDHINQISSDILTRVRRAPTQLLRGSGNTQPRGLLASRRGSATARLQKQIGSRWVEAIRVSRLSACFRSPVTAQDERLPVELAVSPTL
eukprot:9467208-Pyramimonas_sp.AAC.1